MTVGELISAWHAYEESNPAPEPPSSNNPRGTMSFYEVVRAAGAEWDQREERKQKLWEAYRRGEIG